MSAPTTAPASRARRRVLRLLAASPVLPYLELSPAWKLAAGGLQGAPRLSNDVDLIAAARDALSVFDFEAVARETMPPAHWGYMASGTDDDGTVRANRDGFARYQLRVRRLVDVSRIDTSVDLLGTRWESPVLLCPVGALNMFQADGERLAARAAKAKRHLQVLSTATTTGIEDVTAARGEPVWFQLYQRGDWQLTRQLIKRVEAAGAPALVFTVDLLGGRNLETSRRFARRDTRECTMCHQPGPGQDTRRLAMIAGLTPPATPTPEVGTPTWDFVKRLKDATPMKVLIKGIVTREDAELAMEYGADGVFVSNHGGRAEDSLRPTIDCVAEVAAGVAGRAPVIHDGGIRRGTDIFKALALGATAIGIGRPYLWGLAAFGQEGVETVLELLRAELQLVMRQAGTTSLRAITPSYVIRFTN